MQDYRDVIKEHFSNHPLVKTLFMYEELLVGLGLLFLLFSEIPMLSMGTDIFAALGFWCFWVGITGAFIKKNKAVLSLGLGIYILINLVAFIIACVHSIGVYRGFYGFLPLFDAIAAAYILMISGGINYYQELFAGMNIFQPTVYSSSIPQGPSPGSVTCTYCGAKVDQNVKFCSNCGNKTPEVSLCKQCGSPLEENAIFCVKCGVKVETDENVPESGDKEVKVEAKPEKKQCSSCGAEVSNNDRFCIKCGNKISIL